MRSPMVSLRRVVPALLVAATCSAGAQATERVTPAAAPTPNPSPVPLTTGSYDVGLLMGGQLLHNGLGPKDLAVDSLIQGLRDALAGHALSTEERETAAHFMRDARGALAEHNEAAAKAFLERNAKEPGIVALPSGLQYRVLAAGDANGAPPEPTDQVTVRYKASLADGTEIDRSDIHDRPATFRVNTVFKGWQEAFRSMKPGAKWQLFVPPELGYGANSPPMVPPGSLLVYEIELLRVDHGRPMDTPAPLKLRPGAAPNAIASPPKPR